MAELTPIEMDSISNKQHPKITTLQNAGFIIDNNCKVYYKNQLVGYTSDSVDEKLATFPFKIREYKRLLDPIGYDLVYMCKCQYKNDQKVENKNVHFPRSIPQTVLL